MKKLLCLLIGHEWVHLNPEPPTGSTFAESFLLLQAWIVTPQKFWCSRCHKCVGGEL